MSCEFNDFVFGASNLSRRYTRTVLSVRAYDPGKPADAKVLKELACDQEVKALLDRRRLKFKAPAGWAIARGIEQTVIEPQSDRGCYQQPLKVLGAVPRQQVDSWFAIKQQEVCTPSCTPEDIEPLPFKRGFVAAGPALLTRLDLRHGEIQQVVLRVLEKPEPDALYVAHIDHWAESSNPEKQVKRTQAVGSAGLAFQDSKGVEYIGGMLALFVTPHNPF